MSSEFTAGMILGVIIGLSLIMFPLGILVYLYSINLIKDAWRELKGTK